MGQGILRTALLIGALESSSAPVFSQNDFSGE